MNPISNKLSFNKYLILNFFVGILGLGIGFLTILCIILGNWEIVLFLFGKYGIFVFIFTVPILYILYILIGTINPDYFEIAFPESTMRVHYYRLRRQNGLSFLALFSYKRNIKSIELSKDKFEFYALSLGFLKLKKVLHLYGNDRNNLVKFALNISLIKKSDYQTLVNSLERFGLKPGLIKLSKN